MTTHDPETVAHRYGHARDYVMRLARNGTWPHLKIGRAVRFTDAHLAQIDAMHEVKPTTQTTARVSWGRRTK